MSAGVEHAGDARSSLLDGRVIYRQLDKGHRTALEPVLMAASVPARAGDRVLEGGAGAGAGLLCLRARIGGIAGVGVETEPELAALARANAAANGYPELNFVCSALETWRTGAVFDHAMANPPWHDRRGTAAADPLRQTAKFATAALLETWTSALCQALRHRGTLTLILPARQIAQAVTALVAAGCGEIALFPLWPRAGAAAKLIVLRGVKGGRGASTVLPGLILHNDDGSLSDAAESVLRGGAPLLR